MTRLCQAGHHWFGPAWFSTAIALVGGMGFLGYSELRDLTPFARQRDAPAAPALLRMDRQGTDLRISWNRSAGAITNALAGLLSIRDGNNVPQQLHLDADQLRTGSLVYSPASGQVQVQLDLREPDGRNFRESVLALSASDSAAPGGETSPDPPLLPLNPLAVASNSTPTAPSQLPAPTKAGVPVRTKAVPPNVAQAGKAPTGSTASAGGLVPSQVVEQVLPDVPRKARDTIQGTVRVRVRIQVDPSGDVVGAALDSPGPSRYFAGLASQASRRWKFTPGKVDHRDVASEWILRFEFRRTAIRVLPERVSPQPKTSGMPENETAETPR